MCDHLVHAWESEAIQLLVLLFWKAYLEDND